MRSLVSSALLFLALGASAQEQLGRAPWPGMTAWDVAWCKELVYRAQVVQYQQPDGSLKTVWVKDARGWRKPNGYYGIKINGDVVDEGVVWLNYAGSMMNLRVLFTYGSDPVKDVSPFRGPGPGSRW